MKKSVLSIAIIIVLFVNAAYAQLNKIDNRLQVTSVNSIGLLNGSNGSFLSLQSIVGLSMKKSFVGAGVGLDYYRFRSIPVFLDLRQNLGKRKMNVFLYADIGYNFDWLSDKDKAKAFVFTPYNYAGGIYYDAGVGYRMSIVNKDALILSAGYNYKRMRNKTGSGVCPIAGPCFQDFQQINYSMPRLVLKVGWAFNGS